MNRNLIIVIIIIIIAVAAGIFFNFRGQTPGTTGPTSPSTNGVPGVPSEVNLPEVTQPDERTISLTGFIKTTRSNSITIEVPSDSSPPGTPPELIPREDNEIKITNGTVIRSLIYRGGVFAEERTLTPKQLTIGTRVLVSGIEKGDGTIEATLIQFRVSE
jgi:hypothetical protein